MKHKMDANTNVFGLASVGGKEDKMSVKVVLLKQISLVCSNHFINAPSILIIINDSASSRKS